LQERNSLRDGRALSLLVAKKQHFLCNRHGLSCPAFAVMDNASLNSPNVGDFQWPAAWAAAMSGKLKKEFYMQKKIIALAIASAMTVPALAYAEATVYGQARLSIDMVDDGAVTNSESANRLQNQASRVGLKGSEDLGGGLSAVWQMETDVGMDTGATTFFTRNTYLGLKSGDMGTVVLGRNDTPYKTSTRKLDVFIDTVADNRSGTGAGTTGNSGLMSNHDTRWQNSLTYTSPAMGGMSVAVATVFGAETPSGIVNPSKGSALSLAGMYEQGPIYATLAYQTVKAGTAGTGDLATNGATAGTYFGLAAVDDESTAFKLGGSYTMDAITVNAVIEQVKDTVAVGSVETKGTNLYLAGKFGISSTDAVKAAYTKRGETETGAIKNLDDVTQIAIGYDHAMSKSTTVYALYTKYSANGALPDPSVLSFGMNHSF
jgi:predicted porin